LQDVRDSWKSGKQSYRIGSVILYQNNDKNEFEIIDGQQRITTILLILKALNNSTVQHLCNGDKALKYEHIESKQHILENNSFIKKWIKETILDNTEKSDFNKYLMEYCEFVEIVVDDLSEAFQMFDSQNGRGKELEAYNLLKAYHIRAMENETQETKEECDKRWESATRYKEDPDTEQTKDILKQVIDEQLYRTRVWCRKEAAYDFNKSHIYEFKGITIDNQHTIKFPFQNGQLLQYVATKYFESIGLSAKGIKTRFKNGDSDNINPFVLINQHIIDGKQFFDYIETYVEIYKQLFITSKESTLSEFKDFFSKYCEEYKGSHRNGDRYLKELYKSLILLIFDRYGEDGVNKYYKPLYVFVYRLRLEKRQVRYDAVAKYPVDLFSTIEKGNILDFRILEEEAKREIKYEKEIKEIIPVFIEYGHKNLEKENGN
jgi:hypothetical protein